MDMNMLYIITDEEYERNKVPRYLFKAIMCAGTSKCGNEPLGSIKCGEFLD
jgi:hypothetical protein